jgi:putative oxidoreductase
VERILGRFSGLFYFLMRLVLGLLFACHGAQKLLGMFGGVQGHAVPLMSQFGLAGVIELVGGLLIAVGLFSGTAAFIASGEMAWAYFQVHAPQGPVPLLNRGELAVVYCFVWLYVASRGSGPYSLDRLLGRRV